MRTAHTPEPWTVGGSPGTKEKHPQLTIESQFGQVGTVMAENCDNDDQVEADARRIVACVNACKGIETAALESLLKLAMTDAARLASLSFEAEWAMKEKP